MRITVAAPAKINLWLRVGERDASGFHAIDSLLGLLELADTVMVRAGKGREPELETGHARPLTQAPDMGPLEDNLAWRAAQAFAARAGLEAGPRVRLVKRIPPGAGLGGGSSDAAAVLRGLARLHPDALHDDALVEIGAGLGSDIPFFIRGAPLAHATGRGDRVSTLAPLPHRHALLAVPDFPVATGAAYGWLDEDRPTAPPLPDRSGPVMPEPSWDAVARHAANDFEGPVFRRHPLLGAVRDALRAHGARPALLAGSGSTVFGLFDDRGGAQEAARALRAEHPTLRVITTRTRTR